MKKILTGVVLLGVIAAAHTNTSCRERGCYYGERVSFIAPVDDLDRIGMRYYHAGKFSEAIIYHYRACIEGSASGCNHAGYMYDQGKGVLQDYKIAGKYFTLACRYGSGMGCSNLGVLYEEGEGVSQSDLKAKLYYGKSCRLGTDQGCRNEELLDRYLLLIR